MQCTLQKLASSAFAPIWNVRTGCSDTGVSTWALRRKYAYMPKKQSPTSPEYLQDFAYVFFAALY